MLRYVFDQDQLVANFVAQMIPHCRERGFGTAMRAIGVVDNDNELIAGMVYHNLDPEAGVIEMSGAALPGRIWITRMSLRVLWQFPFLQCRAQMVLMRVRASDERLLRQLAALNYTLTRVPRMYGRHADGVLCLLTDDDWAANKFCQKYGHHLNDPELLEAA